MPNITGAMCACCVMSLAGVLAGMGGIAWECYDHKECGAMKDKKNKEKYHMFVTITTIAAALLILLASSSVFGFAKFAPPM